MPEMRSLDLTDEQCGLLRSLLQQDGSPAAQQIVRNLEQDSLQDFHSFLRGYDALRTTAPIDKRDRALKATWWFIENVSEHDYRRNEIFFEVRELVRKAQ